MMKRALTPVNAKRCPVLPHITASVFQSLRSGQASTTMSTAFIRTMISGWRNWRLMPLSASADPLVGCKTAPERTPIGGRWAADAHLKRQSMGYEVVVAVTNGRLDRFAVLTRTFGTWERIVCQLDG